MLALSIDCPHWPEVLSVKKEKFLTRNRYTESATLTAQQGCVGGTIREMDWKYLVTALTAWPELQPFPAFHYTEQDWIVPAANVWTA